MRTTPFFFRDLELENDFSFSRIGKRFGDFLVQTNKKIKNNFLFFLKSTPHLIKKYYVLSFIFSSERTQWVRSEY